MILTTAWVKPNAIRQPKLSFHLTVYSYSLNKSKDGFTPNLKHDSCILIPESIL